jgi:hypothetical protein
MPCWTLVQVEVKDKKIAEKSLKKLGIKADITKNRNGTYTVTPENAPYGFRDKFLQRYGMEKAKVEARKEGYSVSEKTENGEQVLYLRQY